jgi:hypothetical protein
MPRYNEYLFGVLMALPRHLLGGGDDFSLSTNG